MTNLVWKLAHGAVCLVAGVPIAQLDVLSPATRHEMCAHCRLEYAAPQIVARTKLVKSVWKHRRHQRSVADGQFRAGRLGPDWLIVVFLYSRNKSRLAQKPKIMRKRRGVSCILKLPQHLLIGQYP